MATGEDWTETPSLGLGPPGGSMAVDSLTLRKERTPLPKSTINPGITSTEAAHALHRCMTQ
eukprot:2366259-Amphidinium_carterae.1